MLMNKYKKNFCLIASLVACNLLNITIAENEYLNGASNEANVINSTTNNDKASSNSINSSLADSVVDNVSMGNSVISIQAPNTGSNSLADSDNNPSHNELTKKFEYVVEFDGSYEQAYQKAFEQLIHDISNGGTNPSSINVSAEDYIAEESLTDDGDMLIVFDNLKVDVLLRSGLINIWKGLEEPILLWGIKSNVISTIDEEGIIRNSVDTSYLSDNNPFVEVLHNKTKEQNIKIILPLMDLDDIGAIKISDISMFSQERVISASVRYTNGLVLVGNLTQVDDENYKFEYRLLNVSKMETVYNGELIGDYESIATSFIENLKQYLTDAQSILNEVSKDIQNSANIQVQGYENLEDLNLGYVSDNRARILVRNVKTFREVNEVKLCLRDLGYSDVLDIDVKGNDVILVVTKDNLKIAGIKFTEYDAFKNTINDFVYIFNDLLIKSKQKSQIINESKDTLINTVDNEQKIIDNSNEQSISNTNNK